MIATNLNARLLELESPLSTEDDTYSSSLYNMLGSCRVASRILAEAVIHRRPVSATTSARILCLFKPIRRMDPPYLESILQLLLLFVLMIGTAATGVRLGYGRLHCMLSGTISALAASDESFELGLWMTRRRPPRI
jgi:hypothetical protein